MWEEVREEMREDVREDVREEVKFLYGGIRRTKSETKCSNKSPAININLQKSLSYLEYSMDTSCLSKNIF